MPNQFGTYGNFMETLPPSLTAQNSDFKPLFNNDPSLSGSINLGSLSSEFAAMVQHVQRRLGAPILTPELHPDGIAAAFEMANLKYSAIINTYFIESFFAQLLGISVNYTEFDFQRALPNLNNIFMRDFMQSQYRQNSGLYNQQANRRKGFIDANAGQQLYDVYASGYDASTSSVLEQYAASVTAQDIQFVTFYYNEGFYMNKLYDPMTNQQFLASEFGMPSYPVDTVFYIMPLWQDIGRAQLLAASDYTRKSAFRYSIYGRTLELIPRPSRPMRVYFDYYVDQQSGSNTNALADSSFSGLSYLSSISAGRMATNFGNIPVTELTYANMNPIGRNFVREYTVACCMQILALIRGKYQSIPIPGGELVPMNYGDLLSISSPAMIKLEDDLRTELAKLDLYEIMRKESEKADAQLNILIKTSVMPIFKY